jgi:hypothetical protein
MTMTMTMTTTMMMRKEDEDEDVVLMRIGRGMSMSVSMMRMVRTMITTQMGCATARVVTGTSRAQCPCTGAKCRAMNERFVSRYRQFFELDAKLKERFPGFQGQLPKKKVSGNMAPDFVNERKRWLFRPAQPLGSLVSCHAHWH